MADEAPAAVEAPVAAPGQPNGKAANTNVPGNAANDNQEAPDAEFDEYLKKIEGFDEKKAAKVRAAALKKAPIKVKRGSKEESVSDEAALQRLSGLGYGANKIMEEGRAASKQAEGVMMLFQALSSDNEAEQMQALDVLEQMSPKARHAFENKIIKEAQKHQQLEQLPPEARQYKQLAEQQAQQLAEFQRKEAEIQRMQSQEQEKRAFEAMREHIAGQMMDIFKRGNIPDAVAPIITPRLVELLKQNLELGANALPPEDVAGFLKEQMDGEWKSMYGALEGEDLLRFIGDETLAKVRRADLARLNASNAPKPRQVVQSRQSEYDSDDPRGRWSLIERMARGK